MMTTSAILIKGGIGLLVAVINMGLVALFGNL